MEQKILKDWQEKVISFLANNENFKDFYLSGGTALSAFYLRHRISDDLDFFSFKDIDSIFVHQLGVEIKKELNLEEVTFSKLHDRYQFFYKKDGEDLKVEFAKYPFPQLKKTESFLGILVDSEYDIAVNKLVTILDRFDPKDFVDMYFLLDKYRLENLLEGAKIKFGMKIEPIFLGGELAKVRRIETLPRMAKKLTIEDLKTRFEEEIKKISRGVIN